METRVPPRFLLSSTVNGTVAGPTTGTYTDRDHCVQPSWITLGLGYNSILSILADRYRIETPSLEQY